MKTLIIHPTDPTTDFLKGIYNDLPDKTIITGGVTKLKLRKYIETHDRTIFCGHGSPMGLLSVGQFPDSGSYIIDETMVNVLKRKTNSLYIWCYADQFIRRHRLTGFFSGMFCSSVDESWMYKFWDVEWDTIKESNEGFTTIVAKYINEPLDIMYKKVMQYYGILGSTNPIAKFNHERLYLALPQDSVIFPDIVHNMN